MTSDVTIVACRKVWTILGLLLLSVSLAACAGETVVVIRDVNPAAGKVQFASLDSEGLFGPPQTIDGYLYRPAVDGRRPAIVFLHGCGGLIGSSGKPPAGEVDWANRLSAAGYVVLMVDSYTTRGVKTMCAPSNFNRSVYLARSKDLYGALLYLQSLSFVRPDRIGVMGWSAGGGTILNAIRDRGSFGRPSDLPNGDFRAAIAFNPASCDTRMVNTGWTSQIPLLVLVGDADVWTPASPCKTMIDLAVSQGSESEIHIYPGAYHAFDAPNLPQKEHPEYRTTAGVIPIMGTNPAARADALERVPAFLGPYLND
jgi:dienelactone hydrolase